MRVGVLTTSYPRGPDDYFGSFVQDLVRAVARRGHHVIVVAPHKAGTAPRDEEPGVTVLRFRYAPAAWETVAYGGGIPTNLKANPARLALLPGFLAAFSAAAWRLAGKVDVLHAHWTPSGLAAWPAARLRRVPLVVTTHGSDLNMVGKGPSAWLTRFLFKRVAAVVPVSQALADRAKELGAPAGRVQPIYLGVDARRFHPGDRAQARAALGLDVQRPRILFVGMLRTIKGADHLLEAMALVRQRFPAAALSMIGEGPELARLQDLARRLGLDDVVTFHGAQARALMPDWMRAADVFVLPSLMEGRPISILEALASGVPVVASRVGGIPEIVEDGAAGRLVPPASPQDLAAALIDTLAETATGKDYARIGPEFIARSGLDWDGAAERYEALYLEAVRASGQR